MSSSDLQNAVAAAFIQEKRRGTPLSTMVSSPHFASLSPEDKKEILRVYLSNPDAFKDSEWSATRKMMTSGMKDGARSIGGVMAAAAITNAAKAVSDANKLGKNLPWKKAILRGALGKPMLGVTGVAMGFGGLLGGMHGLGKARDTHEANHKYRENLVKAMNSGEDANIYAAMMVPKTPSSGVVTSVVDSMNTKFKGSAEDLGADAVINQSRILDGA